MSASHPAAAESARDVGQRLAGKYMTFQVADEAYGVGIVTVREIIGAMPITRVPRAPAFLRGIINLRAKVIPVVDLRVQFGMTPSDPTDQTVIIVVQCAQRGRDVTMGVLVDRVCEVLTIDAARIEPPPLAAGGSHDPAFILGVGKAEHGVVFLLDVGRVLSDADAGALLAAAA